MLVTRTPLRISFAGGGSDFARYYRAHGGAVLCSAIDKYVHVIVQDRFDEKIRIGYSTTELSDTLEGVQHELVRESMRLVGIDGGIEISTMADVPSTGSGLGSSSSVTVGLLNALHAHRGEPQSKETLAREAVEIEVEILGKPIGKQDQYATAYGGLRKLVFHRDDTVDVRSVLLAPDTERELDESLMLFYTGVGRSSADVLSEQQSRGDVNGATLTEMVELADEMEVTLRAGNLAEFGRLLDYGWSLKKGLASGISNGLIDDLYSRALAAGASGGKITGAGGGGLFLVFCERERQNAVRAALSELREVGFHLSSHGSQVIFCS